MYLDTSVLVAYYCPEQLSEIVEKLIVGQRQPAISDLVEVEFVSALARKVRSREMSRNDARRVSSTFVEHVEARLYARLPLQHSHLATARDWIAGFEISLRTLEALHLAVAQAANLRFVTADGQLARAAIALGIDAQLLESRRPR
jgi:predicted nucleic acid-binding protein